MTFSTRLAAAAALALWLAPSAHAADATRFWNTTSVTIAQLRLAPAGTTAWGANQCDNDKDHVVDPDERLSLSGVTPGRYDVQLADTAGRSCIVRNVEVKGGGKYAFSVSDDELTDCTK